MAIAKARNEETMKKSANSLVIAAALYLSILGFAQDPQVRREPKTLPLECAGGDCVLLKGTPQTSGMRGGSVKLKPGESVGWHSTNQNEEALVILHGSGKASVEGGPDVVLHENLLAYIPPATRQNVTNAGTEALEYVWIVAPTGK